MIKRSVTLAGHKTSLVLEAEFWQAVDQISAEMDLSVPALLTKIDTERLNNNLTSAVRVFVLQHFRQATTPRK